MKQQPPLSQKPDYRKPVIHNNHRRALWHDYRRRCIYMVTVTKRRGAPDFGYLTGATATEAHIEPTAAGEVIAAEIKATPAHNPEIRILSFVIMPDHFHLLMFVTREMPRPLGSVIQAMKAAATRKIRATCARATARGDEPIFEEGFHDRILTGEGQLETLRRYISDNPRRLFVKRAMPDLFRRHNHLMIDDMEFAAYGNIFLLRDFDKMNVVVHRADTPESRRENERKWLACARNGGVLVSPFISPAEKQIREMAIDAGGRLVVLRNEGFEERFKPSGREFELCAEGKLLLLAPWPDGRSRMAVTRREALAMNELARRLATLSSHSEMTLRQQG